MFRGKLDNYPRINGKKFYVLIRDGEHEETDRGREGVVYKFK